jgi:hypothetical protein
MHAKQFVYFAYSYFTRRGSYIRSCQGVWLPTSDNLRQYNQARPLIGPIHAALQTWTGKVFSELGYSEIAELKEEVYSDGKTISNVIVDFVKPQSMQEVK